MLREQKKHGRWSYVRNERGTEKEEWEGQIENGKGEREGRKRELEKEGGRIEEGNNIDLHQINKKSQTLSNRLL